MPDNVIDSDIDAEITEEEAHQRYAAVVADYLVKITPSNWWDAEIVENAANNLQMRIAETDMFYEPFFFMSVREKDNGNSFWAEV